MKVDVKVNTAHEAYIFEMIFRAGLLNMPDWLIDEVKQHPELDTKVRTTYHIKENEKKGVNRND